MQVASAIRASFGSIANFRAIFSQKCEASTEDGGWCWLMRLDDGRLSIESTRGDESPCKGLQGARVLAACDVWRGDYSRDHNEHARERYMDAYWRHLDWQSIEHFFGMHNADHPMKRRRFH